MKYIINITFKYHYDKQSTMESIFHNIAVDKNLSVNFSNCQFQSFFLFFKKKSRVLVWFHCSFFLFQSVCLVILERTVLQLVYRVTMEIIAKTNANVLMNFVMQPLDVSVIKISFWFRFSWKFESCFCLY